MRIGTICLGHIAIAVAVVVGCTTFSTTRAQTISSGIYTGSAGANASGQSTNSGGIGGDGYDFNGGAPFVTGGTFIGGTGGSATGGQFAVGGEGGFGVSFAFDGEGTLTITGGSFQGGAGGRASGASEANESGSAGDALLVTRFGESVTFVVISGGTFAGQYDFSNQGSVIEVYGTFVGGPRTISAQGIASFTGLLADNAASATYTYINEGGGKIILEPEPTACETLIIPVMVLIRRRRGGRAKLEGILTVQGGHKRVTPANCCAL